jgi:hypothetical protein
LFVLSIYVVDVKQPKSKPKTSVLAFTAEAVSGLTAIQILRNVEKTNNEEGLVLVNLLLARKTTTNPIIVQWQSRIDTC